MLHQLMPRPLPRLLLLGHAVLAACVLPPWPEQQCSDDPDCAATDADTTDTTDTTDSTDTAATATATDTTADPEDTAATSDDPLPTDPAAPSPAIFSLDIEPTHLFAAGPLKFSVKHSDDVVALEIWRDGHLLKDLQRDGVVHTLYEHPIANAPGDQGQHFFYVVVRDVQGRTAITEPVVVQVSLPPRGALAWKKTFEPAPALLTRAMAVLQHNGAALIGAFHAAVLNNKVLVDPTVRSYGGDGALHYTLADLPKQSLLTALAGHELNLVAAGYTYEPDPFLSRPWAQARYGAIDIDGTWFGEPGAKVEALARLPDARTVMVGTSFVGPKKNNHDVQVWLASWDLKEVNPILTWANPVDVIPSQPPEDQAFAVAITPAGELVLAGETQVWRDKEKQNIPRAFVLKLDLEGQILATWLAPQGLGECSGALGMSLDLDGGILVAGWSSPDLYGPRIPLLLRLTGGLEFAVSWLDINNNTHMS